MTGAARGRRADRTEARAPVAQATRGRQRRGRAGASAAAAAPPRGCRATARRRSLVACSWCSACSRSAALSGAAVGVLHRHQQPRPGDDVPGRPVPAARATSTLYSSQLRLRRQRLDAHARSGATRCSTTRCARKRMRPSLIRSLELGRARMSDGGDDEPPDRPPLRARRPAVRAARRVHLALDDLRSLLAARQRAQRAHAARAAAHRPRADRRRRRHRARAQRAPRRRHLRTRLPDRRAVRERDRLLLHEPRQHRHRALPQRARSNGHTDTEPAERSSTSCRASSRRARRSSRRSIRPPSASPSKRSAGASGAVVALEPRTGAVTVMASSPSFNPNQLRAARGFAALSARQRRAADQPRDPVGYAPGSTFKVVTATAAIDTGQFTPESTRQRARRRSSSRGCRCRTTTTRASAKSRSRRRSRTRSTPSGRRSREKLGKRDDGALHEPLRLRPQARSSTIPANEMSASGEYDHPAAGCSRRAAPASTSGAWASARTN